MKQRILPLIALLMTGCTATINNPVINADTQVSQQQGAPVATAAQTAPQTVVVNQQINIVQQNQQNNIGVSTGAPPTQPAAPPPGAVEWRRLDAGFVKLKFPSNWVQDSPAPESERSHPITIFFRAGGGALGLYQIKGARTMSSETNLATLYAGAGFIARRSRLIGGRSAEIVLMADPNTSGQLIGDVYVEVDGYLFNFLVTTANDSTAEAVFGDVGKILDSVEWGSLPQASAQLPTPERTSAPAQPPATTPDTSALCDTLRSRGLDGAAYGCAPLPTPEPTPTPTPTPLPTGVPLVPSPTPTPAPITSPATSGL